MTWDEFARFCEARKTGISQKREGENRTELDTLTEYLHEIGVILCYRDEKELENTVFVRPTWVTETIYKVLGLEVMENNGKFDRSQVQQAAPDFDTDELLALMQKFRLVFSVNNEDKQFVAPQYLPAADPKASESFYKRLAARCKNHLFTLRFPEFLPRSVMTGFICQYGPLAKDSYWKNGICFDRGEDWLLVERTAPLEIAVRADAPDPENKAVSTENAVPVAENKRVKKNGLATPEMV